MKVYGPLRKAQLEKVTKPEDLNVPIDGRIFMDDTLTNPNDEHSGKNTPTITLGTTNKEILLSGDAVIHGSANVADTPKPTGVSTSHIVPGSITTADLADGAVTAPKLQRAESIGAAFIQGGEPGAVEGTYDDANNVPIYGNIKPKSIGKYELKDKSVIESKLADDAVTQDKIKDRNVTNDKINTNAVTNINIRKDAVTEDKIKNDAVTEDKIANNAVTGGKLADYSAITSDNSPGITTNKIANEAVTGAKIANRTITGAKISQDGVVAYNIKDASVSADKIAAGAVTAPKLQKATKVLDPTDTTSQKDDDGAVQGTYQDGRNPDNTPKYVFGNIKPHSIDRFELKNDCVTTEKINPGAVTKDKLDTNAVTKDKLADDAVTEDKIKDDAVTEDKIKNGAVTAAKFANYSVRDNNRGITTNKIADSAITTDKIIDGAVTAPKLQKANRPESGGTQWRDKGAVEGTIIGVNPDKSLKYTYGNIKPGSIGRTELRNDCITPEKINPGAVTGGKLADGAVTGAKIANQAVTVRKMANWSVGASALRTNSVNNYAISDGTITGGKLADYSAISADNSPGITTDKIADKAVTRAKLSKAVTDELDTIGSGSASTGGAFLVATYGPMIHKDNNPASAIDYYWHTNLEWEFDSAFPADRVDQTLQVNTTGRPLNSYYLYSKPTNFNNMYLYIPMMHKDLNVIGYKIILEKKTGTDSNKVDIREPISQVFIPLPAALLVKSSSSNVWQTDIKDDSIIRATHILKINKTFPTINVQTLETNAIVIHEIIVAGIGPSAPSMFGSYLSIWKLDGITGTQKIKLYLYEIRV